MKSIARTAPILAVALALTLTGCVLVRTPVNNTTSIENVDFSRSFKSSEACQTKFLFFPQVGDASVMTAAKSGGIKNVEVVDYKSTESIIASKLCVKVWGN